MGKTKVGFHVSIAGAISNSVDNATKLGCTAFQIFTRNPRGWAAKSLESSEKLQFEIKLGASGINSESVVVHMPYLPNLSGPPGEPYAKSVKTLSEELQRCSDLGIPHLVIHLGSHMGSGSSSGISQIVGAIHFAREALNAKKKKNDVAILLENNAGQKNGVGGTFEEIRTILDKVDGRAGEIGVCLDTCHLFTSGYDIRSETQVTRTLEEFDRIVGLEQLRVIHLNDSKGVLGSHLDRHEHIGLGQIGLDGISAFLNHSAVKGKPTIMETPIDTRRGDAENLSIVQGMID